MISLFTQDSVRQKENTRFYLQTKDEVYCSNVAVFVGNLPPNLSQVQYDTILVKLLGKRKLNRVLSNTAPLAKRELFT